MRIPLVLASLLLALSPLSSYAGKLAHVEVYDRQTGQVLPVYSHEGRLFVPGEPKHEYEIRIRNTSGQRLLAVASVDGVNVVSGQMAATEQGGYVLDPHGRVSINGWRKSMDRVATFYFTRLKDSYAARTGRPNDVGVIGVALFREQAKPRCCWPWASKSAEDSAAPSRDAPAAEALAERQTSRSKRAESRLGTGHGRNETSRVTYTEFERASSTADELISIYYDSKSNLIAQGVIPVYSHVQSPNPFPGGFVPDP